MFDFMMCVIGNDVDTSEQILEKKYNMELTRIGHQYSSDQSPQNRESNDYRYDVQVEERGTVFDAICLSYSYLNKTGDDGKVYSIRYGSDMSHEDAAKCYKEFADYFFSKTGKTLGSSRDCFDSDDYCDTTTYAKDGYRFTISLYYYASSDRVTFSVGCSNETEEFYKRSS